MFFHCCLVLNNVFNVDEHMQTSYVNDKDEHSEQGIPKEQGVHKEQGLSDEQGVPEEQHVPEQEDVPEE